MKDDAGNATDLFLIKHCMRGAASAQQDGDTAEWRQGQTMIFSAGRETELQFDHAFQKRSVRLDISKLETTCALWLGHPLEIRTGRSGVDIVAHDIGTWIGHAYAVAYPVDVKRLVLTESNVPGVSPAGPAGVPSETAKSQRAGNSPSKIGWTTYLKILVQRPERAYLTSPFATKRTRT